MGDEVWKKYEHKLIPVRIRGTGTHCKRSLWSQAQCWVTLRFFSEAPVANLVIRSASSKSWFPAGDGWVRSCVPFLSGFTKYGKARHWTRKRLKSSQAPQFELLYQRALTLSQLLHMCYHGCVCFPALLGDREGRGAFSGALRHGLFSPWMHTACVRRSGNNLGTTEVPCGF